jgi:hypothetical protein
MSANSACGGGELITSFRIAHIETFVAEGGVSV